MSDVSSLEDGAAKIRDLISSGKPFFVGRNGTIEMQTIQYWMTQRPKLPYPSYLNNPLKVNAGVFPADSASIDAWAEEYIDCLGRLDATAAGWYAPTKEFEDRLLTKYSPEVFRCPLRSLEPYYVSPNLQWTKALSGKVVVVSSFTKTIQAQLKKDIWPGIPLFSPDIEWSFVQTGYSPTLALGRGDWPKGVTTWQQAVDYVVKGVLDSQATVALIGCGGLGMIIAGRLKAAGVSAIVLGGAIQILFGIKGMRWVTHNVISTFWNDTWVWPAEDETPRGAVIVEGGCYWG